MQRFKSRKIDELRTVSIVSGFNKYAEGSVLIKFGNTHVICNATVQNKVPPFLRGKNSGWVTAEYSMLPRSTHSRMNRDVFGKSPNGRAMEIQRLIGRSLRAAVDLKKLGERQIIIDCDVIQADGGTRCAAINGGFVALSIAINSLLQKKIISQNPIRTNITAVSCVVYKGQCAIDPDYEEDSNCDSDVNFVINGDDKIIEIQGTAEREAFSFEELFEMNSMIKSANKKIANLQKVAIES
ncbi:ribonuclease PH [Flavobacteriaceae bacterium]|nr:ribonuclease PH [Flavobacteriaceae bacterium]